MEEWGFEALGKGGKRSGRILYVLGCLDCQLPEAAFFDVEVVAGEPQSVQPLQEKPTSLEGVTYVWRSHGNVRPLQWWSAEMALRKKDSLIEWLDALADEARQVEGEQKESAVFALDEALLTLIHGGDAMGMTVTRQDLSIVGREARAHAKRLRRELLAGKDEGARVRGIT